MIRNTFKDPNLQKTFEEKGYVLINDFLNQDSIKTLRTFYFENLPENRQGFHASMHSLDFDYRRKVHSIITEYFIDKAKQHLDDYRSVVGNFTVKEPGKESLFDFHLDWSMLDETIGRSVTIWIPLENTNPVNGNLWVLDGSTHWVNTYRCSPGLNLITENNQNIENYKFTKKELQMNAGDAIIYDHKLFHGSPPNLSDQPRIAINLAMLPTEVQSLHYFYKDGCIYVYEVDDDFYHTCLLHSAMNLSRYHCIQKFKASENPVQQEIVNTIVK